MADGVRLVVSCLLLLLTAGCSHDPGDGPAEVKWDRHACERCRMVLSDRHFSAQIRYLPEGKKRTKVLYFDDIGCATLWLAEKPWRDEPGVQIWVTDHRSGAWIDARSAFYVKGNITPMEYGLGAQPESAPDALNFHQAKQHIEKVEERFNVHGVQLLDRLREQAEQRSAARKARGESQAGGPRQSIVNGHQHAVQGSTDGNE